MNSFKEYAALFFIILFLFISINFIDTHTQSVMSSQVGAADPFVVVIDAGHGGCR